MILISLKKLGYIVLYLKIWGLANCKFAFLAIQKFCKFSKLYTPLSHISLLVQG